MRVVLAMLVLLTIGMASSQLYWGTTKNEWRQVLESAWEAEQQGRLKQAIRLYSEAANHDGLERSESARVYLNRGNVWQRLRRWEKARADYLKAVRLDPGYSNGYNNLAYLLATCPQESIQNPGQALDLALKAVALDPTGCHYDTLAAAYAAGGKFDKAVVTQRRAIRLLNGETSDQTALTEAAAKLKMYEQSKPFRQL